VRCPALSHYRYRVIHSCYAILSVFRRCEALNAAKILERANDRTSRAVPAGLTMRQRGGAFGIEPEPAERDQQKWKPVLHPIALQILRNA
jgi:hypothetical protein